MTHHAWLDSWAPGVGMAGKSVICLGLEFWQKSKLKKKRVNTQNVNTRSKNYL